MQDQESSGSSVVEVTFELSAVISWAEVGHVGGHSGCHGSRVACPVGRWERPSCPVWQEFYNSLWGNIFEVTLKSLVGSSSAKPNPTKPIAAIQKSSNSRRGI